MQILSWVRFGASAALITVGLLTLGIATFGIYRLNYVLNRIHVAAKCDTLGTMLIMLGLIISCSNAVTIIKLLRIVVFMWLANPVANHLIVRLEVVTNDRIEDEMEVIHHDSL